jgi:DNA adenine methylase
MRYMGSKRAHFKEYYPVIEKFRQPGQVWVEPFVGGANSIDKVPGLRFANDLHPHLVAMWKALQDGWEPPDEVSEFEYNRLKKLALKGHPPDPLLGFVGFGCAFGGKWFDTYARDDTGVNYAAQTKRTLQKQIAAMPKNEVFFFNGSYDKVPLPPNSFIYCDPPYAETAGYSVGGFDHRRFWKWANAMVAQGHTVLVAEYTAPPDWVPIWQKAVKGRLSSVQVTQSVEKIFTRAMTYDEEAANEYYNPPLHKLYTLKQVLHFLAPACRSDESHIVIDNLRATASTRWLAISAPINIPFDIKPQAQPLAKAIKIADDINAPVVTSMTKAGKLTIKANKFSAHIECVSDHDLMQPIQPSGELVPNAGQIFKAFEMLIPFISEDELRPELKGVYIGNNSCYAVSNVTFAQYWTGVPMRTSVIVPEEFVKMIVQLGEEPESIQLSQNSITFWFHGERRVTTALIEGDWPIERINAALDAPCNPVPIGDEFFEALDAVNAFTDEKESIYIYPDYITSSVEDEHGARVDFATGAPHRVIMTSHYLEKLQGVATGIDWSRYPQACTWRGERMRGVTLGRSVNIN